MHELSITRSIIGVVTDAANGCRVRRVTLEIGKLSGISTEALAFAFEVAAEGTVLEGAVLGVAEIEGRARCTQCGAEFATAMLYDACACGSYDLVRLAGEELNVKSIEIEEAA